MIKVFLDSNIIISHIILTEPESNCSKIISLCRQESFSIVLSTKVLDECLYNIESKYNNFLKSYEQFLDNCTFINDCISPYENIEIAQLPAVDKLLLTTAIYNGIDYFLTGNENDFKYLYGNKYGNTLIMKPKQFLDIYFPIKI